MNDVRITYIICSMISTFGLLAIAIATPIWVTPGQYWWTALCIFMILGSSWSFTSRVNQWPGMGEV